MPVQGAYWWSVRLYIGSGESVMMNFAPANALAMTSVASEDGGLCDTGFTQYRSRRADGSDEHHDFSASPKFGLPPAVRDENMTSVTAQLTLGTSGEAAHRRGGMNVVVWYA